MSDKFEPTHIMIIGKGRKKCQYRVKAIEIPNSDYYNVVISPNSSLYRNGTHFVSMVPQENLKEIASND